MSENKTPQHLHFLNSALRWDWRKEDAVELILLVFLLTFFFALPRAGCGVTDARTAQHDPTVSASELAPKVDAKPVQGAVPAAPPEG